MTNPRKTPAQFYEARVVRGLECWAWTGRKDAFGYGVVQLGRGEPRTGAHRVSWELHVGPIPEGMQVLHHCDNPECTNPSHLFLGTPLDNMLDASAKGRLNVPSKGWLGKRSACPNGHPFDESNTYLYRNARLCKACRAENQAAYKKRKNA